MGIYWEGSWESLTGFQLMNQVFDLEKQTASEDLESVYLIPWQESRLGF